MTPTLFFAAMAGAQTVTVDASDYLTTDSVVVTWADMAAAGATARGFVALAEVGSYDNSYEPEIVVGSFDGSATFDHAPVGTVEVRFYDSTDTEVVIGRSAPFTVAHPAGEFPVVVNVDVEPQAGDDLTFDFENADGYIADWIAVAAAGSSTTDYVAWAYTDGLYDGTVRWSDLLDGPVDLASGDYEVRLFSNNGYGLSASSTFSVDAGDDVVAAGTFESTQTVYTPSESVLLEVTGAPAGAGDWVGLGRLGFGELDDSGYVETMLVSGSDDSFVFAPVDDLGPLVGRYFEGATLAQWAADVDVDIDFLPATSPTLAPTLTTPVAQPSGARIDVSWSDASSNPTNFVAIAPAASATNDADEVVAWSYTDSAAGSHSFYEALPAGDYVVRYYELDSWTLAAESISFAVYATADVADIVIPDPHVDRGEPLGFTILNVELDAGSFIGMYAAGSSEHASAYAWSSLPSVSIDSASGAVPASVLPLGSWELRLYNSAGHLYASEPFTVGDIICEGASMADADSDGVCDLYDVCPAGDDSVDFDLDGVADACDACPEDALDDSDADGSCDVADTCPGFDDYLDSDADGIPDDCDECPDQAGVCDSGLPRNCAEILADDAGAVDGLYEIDPDADGPLEAFEAFCDMTSHGGGWTLVMATGTHTVFTGTELQSGTGTIPSSAEDPGAGVIDKLSDEMINALRSNVDDSIGYWVTTPDFGSTDNPTGTGAEIFHRSDCDFQLGSTQDEIWANTCHSWTIDYTDYPLWNDGSHWGAHWGSDREEYDWAFGYAANGSCPNAGAPYGDNLGAHSRHASKDGFHHGWCNTMKWGQVWVR